jgi:hypothetical protein
MQSGSGLDPAKYLDPNSAKYLDPVSAKYLDPNSVTTVPTDALHWKAYL